MSHYANYIDRVAAGWEAMDKGEQAAVLANHSAGLERKLLLLYAQHIDDATEFGVQAKNAISEWLEGI